MMRVFREAIICAVLLAFGTSAQTATNTSTTPPQAQAEPPWAFSGSAYAYFVPESDNYVQPTITADRGRLHLEARYNYEDRDAASGWIGYNFSVGEKLMLDITPMLGGVFGNTTGIAPGYHLTLSWKKLGFYTEGEYVFNTRERADSFFYSWSELTLSPIDWFRLGLATQKTRAYKSERDIQRGFFLGFSLGKVEVSGYVFNPDLDRPTYVLSVSGEF